MSLNSLISSLNKLEKWLDDTKSNYYLMPLRIGGYLLLFLALMVSNLFAIIRWPVAYLKRTFGGNKDPQLDEIVAHSVNEVNTERLEQVLETKSPVLIDFWAEWCGPCIMMNKSLQRLAESDQIDCTVVKVDTVKHKALADSYNVKGLPTLLLIKNGEELKRYAGALSYHELKDFIQP
ncbi:thioredoxin family protein [Fodinibius salsisoli]|uniref:Thioredoxin family protein n=1 Tax=Fodinibius salsisoli TaxID=2820877 RepID=A0ABT3PR33_9BACT|nr:thioredoxin family protein [Fodinibius salsisoli]MCW9708324.1 thioredoxin family protein [Fodinibius salsisoli]